MPGYLPGALWAEEGRCASSPWGGRSTDSWSVMVMGGVYTDGGADALTTAFLRAWNETRPRPRQSGSALKRVPPRLGCGRFYFTRNFTRGELSADLCPIQAFATGKLTSASARAS